MSFTELTQYTPEFCPAPPCQKPSGEGRGHVPSIGTEIFKCCTQDAINCFSDKLVADTKQQNLTNLEMNLTYEIKRTVGYMSSLGMGILKKGLEMGIAEGFEIGLAEGLAKGFEIGLADVTEIDKIQTIKIYKAKIIEMYKAKAIEKYKAKAIETGLAHAMYDLVNAGLITPTTGAEMTNKLPAEFETCRAEYNRQKSLPSIPTG